MKIVAFGDVHIGVSDTDNLEVMKAIEYICKDAPACDLIVITGDVYNKLSDPAMRNKAVQVVDMLTDIAPVAIVKGNHDRFQDLVILERIKCGRQVTVYERPAALEYGDATLLFVPWISKAEWTAVRGIDDGVEATDDSVSGMFMTWLRTEVMRYRDRGARKIYLFSHLTVTGCRVSETQEIMGGGIMVGTDNLKDAGIDGGVFGHIHMPQVLGDGSFVYTGSLTNLNFGETDKTKAYAYIDTVTGTVELKDVPVIPRVSVSINWIDGAWDSAPIDELTDTGIRLRVRIKMSDADDRQVIDSHIRNYLEARGFMDVHTEFLRVPKEQDTRHDEVTECKTVGEKLVAYWGVIDRKFPTPEAMERTLQLAEELTTEIAS